MNDELQEERKRTAELWALASDNNIRHLLVWTSVRKRAEKGGFNGVLVGDYGAADEALASLDRYDPGVPDAT